MVSASTNSNVNSVAYPAVGMATGAAVVALFAKRIKNTSWVKKSNIEIGYVYVLSIVVFGIIGIGISNAIND